MPIDHLLLSPAANPRRPAGQVHSVVTAELRARDHAPTWIELAPA